MTGNGMSARKLVDEKGTSKKKAQGLVATDEQIGKAYGLDDLNAKQKQKVGHLIDLLKAIRMCNKAKSLDEAIAIIIESTCNILNCDRATLFMVDEIRDELVIRHAIGSDLEDIRIPSHVGIAGAVYQQGQKLNIADPYNDTRFNKDTDKKTGYKTESILCVPIVNADGEAIAVLQGINKLNQDGKVSNFHGDDEMVMEHMALQVGVVLANQLLSERTKRVNGQVVSLLEIVKSLHSNMGINSLMFTITEKSPSLVDADRCTLYLVDRSRNELWSLQGAVEIRVPMDKGLIGACATSMEIVNIKDAWEDDRFNKDFDKQSGYRTRSVLCMPIRDQPEDGSAPQMVGVLQLINKLSAPAFQHEDEVLLQSFVDIAGKILSNSQLFAKSNVKEKSKVHIDVVPTMGGSSAAASMEKRKEMKKMGSRMQMSALGEGEEEEE